MEKFRDLLEAADLTPEDFVQSVESNFKKHFPNGFISVESKVNELGTASDQYIRCTMGMIGNPKDNTNGIAQNDKMRHTFIMWKNGEDTYSFEGKGKVYINPLEGSYNAMDSIKTKMGNNSKITLAKADAKMAKFFKKLSGIMKDNVDDIYGSAEIDKKYKVFK